MKIVKDSKQIRTTIPKEFVKEFDITKQDSVEWNNDRRKLTGKLIQNKSGAKE